jgi:hypothetical protein
MSNIKAEKRAEAAEDAVFPCILKILPQFVFMKKDPIILGCEIVAGIAKVGALLAALETFGWWLSNIGHCWVHRRKCSRLGPGWTLRVGYLLRIDGC